MNGRTMPSSQRSKDQTLGAAKSDNKAVFEALCRARPRLIGLAAARDAIPDFVDDLILHAGPPIAWKDMTAAMQAAVAGGLIFERRCADLEKARRLAESGRITFAPAH